MGLIIREAQEDDIPAIYGITREAFEKYARDLGLPQQVSALKDSHQSILQEMKQKVVLVAFLDDMPVGTIRFEVVSGNIAYISRFGVRLDIQNCGVGKALIQAVEDRVRALGADIITLHTASKMTSLVRLYYGAGFYIHSTATGRGYIRALFVKELTDCPLPSLAPVVDL